MQTPALAPLVNNVSPLISRALTNASAAALLGLGLRRKPAASPIAWLAAGVALGAIGATAAVLLAPASTRERLTRQLQSAGGSVGQRVGQVIGKQVGAHPVATAKLAEGARDLLGRNDP
ncbi:MAG TPA: YtxH domain-containing protein [Polyangiaceae bacterium]|nr:YtxH domain-containing protein [Polyangiaceae bacterium]